MTKMSHSDALMNLHGSQIRGYQLLEPIGSGSYGVVYLAFSGPDSIAIKVSVREEDLLMEASVLQQLYYKNVSPKFFFNDKFGPFHTLGMEILGPDIESLRQKADFKFFERPTLIKFTYQALTCLEALHTLKIVHRDVKLSNFAVTKPTTPENRVAVRIFDFGLSHVYADADGTLRDDPRNFDFKKMKYAAYEPSLGCDPMPKDDICQLGYAVMYAAGFDFGKKLKCPDDELSNWKRELIRVPAETLPLPVQFMLPFYELVGDLDDIIPIQYDLLKQRVQECMPEVDTSDLILSDEDGRLTLI
ncbi:hypothetical protein B9Z55_026547 [Caenorhabditis nigoni]|uniref:Protein kinase domain-containing protein n=2 Tax=Caenorhabditis nigoni TaxID=1611254 RepID=A0A2G5T3R3_9PELO|nr:hypothetical protein B9Z55_026547 [Caenorhabditis nigoni]